MLPPGPRPSISSYIAAPQCLAPISYPVSAIADPDTAVLPIKDVIPPRRAPHLSTSIVAAAILLFPMFWWWGAMSPLDAFLFLVNVLYVCVFADNVEDRLGRGRFAALYVASHAAGSAAAFMLDPAARVSVGLTSGAVAGVAGAYLVLYPSSRILTLVPVPFDLYEVPATFVLGLFLVLHLAGGTAEAGQTAAGLLTGGLLCLGLRRPMAW